MHKMITYFESNVFEMLENASLDTSQGVKVVRDGAVSWFVGPRWDGHEMYIGNPRSIGKTWPTLPKTTNSPRAPKGKDRLPTSNFQGLC